MLSSLARTKTLPGGPSSVPALDDFAPRTQFGRYVFAGEIGFGGMGVVYAAHDPELDRLVAVKLLRGDSDPQLELRLRREAQAMAQLAHPNVVTVHDVGAFEGRMFIAMEYVEGETLARWLHRPRSQREILEVYCAAGRGLAAAHAAGIVHRDFKPENVLIGRDGRVRVGDFGLACPTCTGRSPVGAGPDTVHAPSESAEALARLTTPGTLLGTRHYMAPELYQGAVADARSDQFSFCVALFASLHRRRPFEVNAASALARNPQPIPLREIERARVPRRVRAALRRGLAIDPASRFPSLDELLEALAPSPHRLRRPLIAVAAAVAAMLVLVAWYSLADSADPRCTGAAAAFASTWNPARRASVEGVFAASTAPYAAAAFARVTGALDEYATRWTQAHTQACRATRILGEQTEATLDLRMACLERRRQEVAALVGTLSAADGAAIGRSVTATESLGDIASCADVAA
ncbi:MAG TPA: serine/threonine-protein kinase, partial [Kofleriaceae bacterium]|nr:serine/threonine-protein kinase [Kofleriaceae bacterium]